MMKPGCAWGDDLQVYLWLQEPKVLRLAKQ